MKKVENLIVSFFIIGIFVLVGEHSIWAQTPTRVSPRGSLGVPSASSGGLSARGTTAGGPLAIGVAAAVSGRVEASTSGQSMRSLQSGSPIFLKDKITTDSVGHLQLLLRDETAFTIGPDSEIVMDQFVYDPASDAGKVSTQITKGVFRFVTGKIARKKPENMEIHLPVGSIGIRGTIGGGRIEPKSSLVVLLGPGKNNNTGHRKGELKVTSEVGNPTLKSVILSKTGFGTTLVPGQAPTTPIQIPHDVILGLSAALQPPRNIQRADDASPGEGEDSASEQAGQDTFGALDELSDAENISDLSGDFDQTVADATQNATQFGRVVDGITTFEDLRRIETGIFHFETDNVSLSSGGSFAFDVDIDFGARTIGGGQSGFDGSSPGIDGGNNFDFLIPTQSFASGSGLAIFKFSGLTDLIGPDIATASLDLDFDNFNGVIADETFFDVTIIGGTSGSGSGFGDAHPRETGLSS